MLHRGSVSHTHGDNRQLIRVVTRQVVEVLAKERRVEERHLRTFDGLCLYTLIIDGCHLTAHAFALNPVANPQATAHELDAVNKVVDDVLECNTDTS